MEKEYLIAFSSFYKAAYAQDSLEEEGVRSTMRKLPIQIARSCSTGIYLKGVDIENVKDIFEKKNITTRGIYRINRENEGHIKYELYWKEPCAVR